MPTPIHLSPAIDTSEMAAQLSSHLVQAIKQQINNNDSKAVIEKAKHYEKHLNCDILIRGGDNGMRFVVFLNNAQSIVLEEILRIKAIDYQLFLYLANTIAFLCDAHYNLVDDCDYSGDYILNLEFEFYAEAEDEDDLMYYNDFGGGFSIKDMLQRIYIFDWLKWIKIKPTKRLEKLYEILSRRYQDSEIILRMIKSCNKILNFHKNNKLIDPIIITQDNEFDFLVEEGTTNGYLLMSSNQKTLSFIMDYYTNTFTGYTAYAVDSIEEIPGLIRHVKWIDSIAEGINEFYQQEVYQ